jgi:hypothetical protein
MGTFGKKTPFKGPPSPEVTAAWDTVWDGKSPDPQFELESNLNHNSQHREHHSRRDDQNEQIS